MKCLKR